MDRPGPPHNAATLIELELAVRAAGRLGTHVSRARDEMPPGGDLRIDLIRAKLSQIDRLLQELREPDSCPAPVHEFHPAPCGCFCAACRYDLHCYGYIAASLRDDTGSYNCARPKPWCNRPGDCRQCVGARGMCWEFPEGQN